MIKITIADDHTLVRQGLRKILEAEPDMQVVGEAKDCAEVLRLLERDNVDVLVLDISMPGAGETPGASASRPAMKNDTSRETCGSTREAATSAAGGLEVLRQLQHRREAARPAKPKVLIVSMYSEARFAVRTLKLGAAGYMTKDCAAEELVEAIRRIHRGGKFISTGLGELLAADLDGTRLPHERLSNREMEIFQAVASGKKISEIAQALSLSAPTVYTYRTRIFEKMDMTSNAELIRYALDYGLLD
jgi:two-component system invasion response regulator UvrY